MAMKNGIERVRVNGFLPKSLVDDIDTLAGEYGLTRFSMMCVILKQYMNALQMPGLISDLKDIQDKNVTISNNLDMYELSPGLKSAYTKNIKSYVDDSVPPVLETTLESVLDKSDFE